MTTNTMDPPSIPSIILRDEWSLGKVLALYWKWLHLGDCYVCRSLSGLDPDSKEFNTLPSHFTADMDNDYIMEAMNLCFGPIMAKWGHLGIYNVLSLGLASMVYHLDFLLGYVDGNSKHPFNSTYTPASRIT